jgi:Heavy metal binding domain
MTASMSLHLHPFAVPFVLALALVPAASPQERTPPSRESYPVYLCPVHRDQQATGPGRCPVCDRELVLRVLVSSFSCPMHPQIDEGEPGRCPICQMTLVPTTRELQWYCPGRADLVSTSAGACPDGSPMRSRPVPMAHGDHNPRHGGILFMAPNGYNHLEGTLGEEGAFRLYLYDDFTRPIDARPFTGTVDDRPLTPAADGSFLSAAAPPPPGSGDPTELVVQLRFPGSDEDTRFDFVFAPRSAEAEAEAAAVTPPARSARPELRVPDGPDRMYAEILRRNDRLQELIRKGSWPDLYIPALEAKDLVLALSKSEGERVAIPAKKLVRAAWLLDTYGDLGNRLEVESAYRLFHEAIRELETAHERR